MKFKVYEYQNIRLIHQLNCTMIYICLFYCGNILLYLRWLICLN